MSAADSSLPRSSGPSDGPASETTAVDGERRTLNRSSSTASTKVEPTTGTPTRSGTLKKTPSLRKRASLSRRNSRKSLRAGSMRGMGNDEDDEGFNNVFHTPIPTSGNPTEVLANRFNAWRKLLKDLITYFREIQSSYEHRGKNLLKISNVINNTQTPGLFMTQGGLNEALTTLKGFHKISLTESNKSKGIEEDVITQLNGLRNDLSQKIKEIKSLSGDFKNSVDKEKDNTRKAVEGLKDALAAAEAETTSSGKGDPYIVKLGVDRQVEKQIEEENYLHRAYLNLEGSGRELESIVVGEIQKAYNAYAGILRRETEHAHEAFDDLRSGPIAMPKDHEWTHFVENDEHFINPNVPLREIENVYYPGKFNPAASEIRGGMLERKSKYLKSYTPGWYVLSPTHLHEFRSADHIHTQQPIMSLYLLDQKLGSHSQPGAGSHKFSLKGRQTGSMHRGHSWVFRAESYDTMMAWYEDIRNLTEKTGAEKTAFVRKHARSVSAGSHAAPSVSSDGLEEDEADAEPYAAHNMKQDTLSPPPKRPSPGGRFPSDIDVQRGLTAPLSPSSSADPYIRDGSVTDESPTVNRDFANHNQYNGVDGRDQTAPLASTVVAPSALDPATAPHQSAPETRAVNGQYAPDPAGSHRMSGAYPHQENVRDVRPEQISQQYAQTQPTTHAHKMSAVNTPPSQASTFPSAYPGDATQDSIPAAALVGGAGAAAAAGGAGAYALYHNHQDPQQEPTAHKRNLSSNQQDLSTDRPLEADYPTPTPSPGPHQTSNPMVVPTTTTTTTPALNTLNTEPAGVYPDPVTDYTSPPSTSPPPTSTLNSQQPPFTPMTEQPTLPDLNSEAFVGAEGGAAPTPRAVSPLPQTEPATLAPADADMHAGAGEGVGTDISSLAPTQGQTDGSSLASTTDEREVQPQSQPEVVQGTYFKQPAKPTRRGTNGSVSQLHVPGEFPGTPVELA